MEAFLFIVSILCLGLSFAVLISGIFKHNVKDVFKTKYAKVSVLLLIIYIVIFIAYLIIAN
ncbi:hypothetical protein [Amphibacillus cookii]|uniref:hypothetical protein n=1 Tax=Amphibacillus cookii TaxID=767787 RepID=UPI001956C68C|nr:hypothetical protein [Amphibacillus cookii]MBM7541817.1 hypothetical protein [Amphibacillus cookii]